MSKDDIINELLNVLPDECSISYAYVKFVDKNKEEMVAEVWGGVGTWEMSSKEFMTD